MSLHERFTQLRKIVPQPIEETPATRPPPPAPPRISHEYYVPPPERVAPEPRVERARMAVQPRYRRDNRMSRQLAIEAALKLKRKSIKQRLGIRQNSNFRRNQTFFGWRGARARRLRGRFRGINRFNRQGSQNGNVGRRRGGPWRRGFGGRGGGRGGRRRGGRKQQQPKVTKEELDQQLDSYMANTKSVLDRDLDEYMSQKPVATVPLVETQAPPPQT